MKKLLVLTFLVSACSTVPESKDTALKREVLSTEATKQFTEPVSAVVVSRIKQTNCEELASKLSAKWNWKSALEAASACYKSKNNGQVNSIAQELATKEPNSPWGPYWLALLAYDANQPERADWMIELAYARGSDSSVINYLRGQIQWSFKKYHEAVESFEAAVGKDESLVPAHILLGQVYYQDQDFEKSLLHFNLALKYESKNPNALYGFAECELQLKNSNDAINTLYKLADRDPSDARYYLRIADIQQFIMQDLDGAMKAYKKLQKNIKAGVVQKNIDPQWDNKMKQLESQVASREVATKEGK